MRRLLLALVALAVAAALPASASASITGSTVQVPADGSYFFVGDDPGPDQTISGTVTGTPEPSDKVDIWCVSGASSNSKPASNVDASSGSFTTMIDYDRWRTGTCRLIAIPAGGDILTIDRSPFHGPLVTADYRQHYRTDPGATSGNVLVDYYFSQQQAKGFADYASLAQGGLYDMNLYYGDTGINSEYLFYGNGWLQEDEGDSRNRSSLQIDGRDAYASDVAAYDFDPGAGTARGSDFEGVPPLTVTDTGGRGEDVTIEESEDLVTCEQGADAWPHTNANCGRLVPTGVRFTRRVRQTREGTLVLMEDVFSSVDGQPHEVDVNWIEDFRRRSGDLPTAYDFTWTGAGFATHDAPDKIAAPPSPATVFIRGDAGAAEGDRRHPYGVMLWDTPAGEPEFHNQSRFVVPMKRSISLSGEVHIRWAYAMATTRAEAEQVAAGVRDGWFGPTLEITSPADGSTVTTPEIDVTGRSVDSEGAPTVTVNDVPATVRADGPWSARVRLHPGRNMLTITADDGAGNRHVAAVFVDYLPPPVVPTVPDRIAPALTGVSLSATTFRVAAGATAVAAATRRGTTVRYTLSEPATVSFAISRATKGRRVGARCRRATRRNRRKRACTRYVKTGRTIARQSPAGGSTLKFTGRIGTKKLKPGRYRMAIAATDAARNRSKASRLRFRIVRR
ncbi:MAG TPA: hypothetical protein VF549_13555 [Solirubrobacteraceae bacterium]|jgi:hypothetical protein